MHPAPKDPGGTRLLAFLGPGLVHGLGNALFAVQGHMQVLGTRGGDIQRDKQVVLASSQRAMDLLELFRSLVGSGVVQDTPLLANSLLQQLQDLFRVAVRELGFTLQIEQSCRSTPVAVLPSVFGRGVARAAQTLAESVPKGMAAKLVIDLLEQEPRQVQVRVAAQPEAGALPFPLDLDGVLEDLSPDLSRWGIGVVPEPQQNAVRLKVPTAEGTRRAVLDRA